MLCLGISLGDLVIVEQAAHALGLAVEEIDEAPEEIRQIRFKTCLGEEAGCSLEDRRQREFRGLRRGEGARIALFLQWAIAMELKLIEEVCSGRSHCDVCPVVSKILIIQHRRAFPVRPRIHAGP